MNFRIVTVILVLSFSGCHFFHPTNWPSENDTDSNTSTENPNPEKGTAKSGFASQASFESNSTAENSSKTNSSSPQSSEKEPAKKKKNRITKTQSIPEMALFQPTKYPDGFRRLTIEGQRVQFVSEDETKLDGRIFRGANTKQVILFCHGNGGNLTYRTKRMDELHKRFNVAIFLFDYRGYGRSEGKPTISGVLADGRAALRKAAEVCGVKPQDVIVMGRSLGGAIATALAAEFKTKGLIIESSFSSFKEEAKYMTGGTLQFMVSKNSLNSAETIKGYHGRVLISHGTSDGVIPYKLGKKLFDAANQPKMFYEVDRGRHNDEPSESYLKLLGKFFDEI